MTLRSSEIGFLWKAIEFSHYIRRENAVKDGCYSLEKSELIWTTRKKACVQNVADDADAPHVGAEVNRFKLHHFGSHEFRRTEQHSRVDTRRVDACQTEVDYFDAISCLA